MNPTQSAIEHWPDRLERVIIERCTRLQRVFVLRETDSTQDAARRMNAAAGDVYVAWRQTAGRGRLGRTWTDTGEDGLAVTIAIKSSDHPAAMLSIASAVAVAKSVEPFLRRPVQIKWPNDILIDGRKLAGVLIETIDDLALIGIGINVNQTSWPAELNDRAVSMKQSGVEVDRLDVLAALLPAFDAALRFTGDQLKHKFEMRDALRGTSATFRSGERTITGIVKALDPFCGLAVQTDSGEVWLDASTTTVIAIGERCYDFSRPVAPSRNV